MKNSQFVHVHLQDEKSTQKRIDTWNFFSFNKQPSDGR